MVSVIVPARDAGATLGRTLQALCAQRIDEPYEVIVVDDGSTDTTAAIARAAGSPVRLITMPPLGPAAARNCGVQAAGGTRLAFCDADVFPAPDWLAAGCGALAGADLVQGRVTPDPLAMPGPFDRSLHIDGAVGLWETANLFVTRDLFTRAGGFEQWIAPWRGKALAEDVWFGHRALRAGGRAEFCPDALAHHAVHLRGPWAYATERARLRFFPAMTARMPELRSSFLHRRWFLNRRTARLDLALGAAAIGALARPSGRRAWPALTAALPYLLAVRAASARAPHAGPSRATIAAVDVAADLIGAGALAYGSVRYRAPVL
ncbi:MAG: glycosyltransferase family A protein [Solirubrobacteraceae bacterium]